eukprot:gnl/TRDRNA2_/TRDRNA2_75144_c0_seq1.p1 gnl/TRDRNA2_/TRDRNA2_75144_c0~~gnl/TRDRNA2_/TRDRNA2_75144_c0_seq1.p1  ORF type:complete len:148 (-),score=25.36 gnl/TRDRNA2_/TRDRNA2_75144_c0_seq1:30-473(-)
MYAMVNVTLGEQLYNSYGYGSPRIFRDWGFVEQSPQAWWLYPAKDDRYENQEGSLFEVHDGEIVWPAPDQVDFEAFVRDAKDALDSIDSFSDPGVHDLDDVGQAYRAVYTGTSSTAVEHLARQYREAYRSAIELAMKDAEHRVHEEL